MLPQKSLPLTREVAFAEQMTEGETGRPHGAAPTNPNGQGGLTPPHPALRATFPPGGRSGASGRPRPTWSAPFVGAGDPYSFCLASLDSFPLIGGIGLTGPRAATWGRPFVVASSTSLASACGESSLIPLLRLSPPNPRLSPLGFGGGPK